jgi:nucleosome assembly protein 1-like 1
MLTHVQSELGYAGDFIFDHAKGTQIVWKEDKDLTKEIEIKKQRNKSASSSGYIPTHVAKSRLSLRLVHFPPSLPMPL